LEINALAQLLDISPTQFVEAYTRLRADRQGLALTEKENGECVFLEGKICRVQQAKPGQCRDFPNRWNFPGFDELCDAVPVELSEEQYREKVLGSTVP